MNLTHIIFDMDGLMIDSESVYWAAGRKVAGRFGKTVQNQTLGRMMGRSPIDSMRVFAEELGLSEPHHVLLEMRDSMVRDTLQIGVTAMPGLFEVLPRLHRRFTLGIATSAPRSFVDLTLPKLDIGHYFKAVQTSDGVIQGKPDPEIYLKAMERLGAQPPNCVVLEDSSNGSLAGKRAGAYVIAVPSQYTRDQEFSFVDYIARDLLDAAHHVESIAGAGSEPSGEHRSERTTT
jgi:HAD superfamily hydrolase (TIGR01509 family)